MTTIEKLAGTRRLKAVVAAVLGLLVTGTQAAEHTVYRGFMPEVLWTRGCTPTSATMVLGYWDMHNPWAGAWTGYGRLVDNWRDLSMYSDGTGPTRNVPSVLDELRLAMGTDVDGVTSTGRIGTGITQVTNSGNGYCFASSQCAGWSWLFFGNDFCWGTITAEINAQRPVVWSVGVNGQVGHSLAAWGYTDDKYVMVYNTWNTGTDYWYYTKYDNGTTTDWQYVDTVVPGCRQTGDDLYLSAPTGGTVLTRGQTYGIQWLQYGSTIAAANGIDLYYSVDGGASWSWIAGYLPSHAGWNSYTWTVPNLGSSRVRVKALGYSATNAYIAGDGSRANLTIQ